MIETEPALLYLWGQTWQPFIDGTPFAEYFQPFGTSVGESLFKMEHSQIVDIVVEIHIDTYHLVVEQEPSGFGKAVTVFVLQYGTDG